MQASYREQAAAVLVYLSLFHFRTIVHGASEQDIVEKVLPSAHRLQRRIAQMVIFDGKYVPDSNTSQEMRHKNVALRTYNTCLL